VHSWTEETAQASSIPTPGISPEKDLSDARQASLAAGHLDYAADWVRRMLINRSNKLVKGDSAAALQKYITAAHRVNEHARQVHTYNQASELQSLRRRISKLTITQFHIERQNAPGLRLRLLHITTLNVSKEATLLVTGISCLILLDSSFR
jgi:hypothetical protein